MLSLIIRKLSCLSLDENSPTLKQVYVLHSPFATQSTQYVALTRQTQSLRLYVAQDETPSLDHLIRQMGREDSKRLSLSFDTSQDIQKHATHPSLASDLKHTAAQLLTKATDVFHKNGQFYTFEKPQPLAQEPVTASSHSNAFETLERKGKEILYDSLKTKNRLLTPELENRITLQAEKAAEFMIHHYILKETQPTQKQIRLCLLRAKYELDRLPDIRQAIMKEWKQQGNFHEMRDPLLIHMIAERQASLEGRIFMEAKQKGIPLPSSIAELAEKELQAHREQTKPLAQKLSKTYSLSETAAISCAKTILRYIETHGEKPSQKQMSMVVDI